MLTGKAQVRLHAVCIAALGLLFSCLVYAEPPLEESLDPEPSHVADEREVPLSVVRAYQRVMAQGVKEFDAGHWSEARALFRRGHELLPNARSFRVLGMTAFNLKQYPAALRELSWALSDPRRPLAAGVREQTEELRDRAQAFVGLYHVDLAPPSAELRVDGLITKLERDATLLLSVGEHVLEVEAPEHLPLRRSIMVDGADGQGLWLRLRPLVARASSAATATTTRASATRGNDHDVRSAEASAARSPFKRVMADYRWSWLSGGSALILGGAATYTAVRAREEGREAEQRCPGTCLPWDGVTDERDSFHRWSRGLLVSSVLLAVVTVVLIAVERQRVKERERFALAPRH